jgi:hypothetical protein
MIVDKGLPALGRRVSSPDHILGYARLSDINAELEKLSMMSSTLGAPYGGTTRGGHHSFESLALCWITLPNFGGGGGSCLPPIVIVALGDPGAPLICWAIAPDERAAPMTTLSDSSVEVLIIFFSPVGYQNIREHAQPHLRASVGSHQRRESEQVSFTVAISSGMTNSRIPSQEPGQHARRRSFEGKCFKSAG